MARHIFATFGEIRRLDVTVLLVEQNVHLAFGVADRASVMERGASASPARRATWPGATVCREATWAGKVARRAPARRASPEETEEPRMAITPGLVGEIELVVAPSDTAAVLGNAGIDVLSTPRLVGLLEAAAIRAVEPHLQPGAGTVGTHLDVRHLAATPVGMRVRVRATLRAVSGRRLVYDVEAHDQVEKVAEGSHERAQIDPARFLARVAEKARRA